MRREKIRKYDRPRIDKLYYKVITAKSVDYDKASNVSEETDEFVLTMDKDQAVFKMKCLYSSVEEAKSVIEDYLERWKVVIGLEHDPGDLDFQYDTFEFEQVVQDGKNVVVHAVPLITKSFIIGSPEIHERRNEFPKRLGKFKLSPDVLTMYERFKRYRQGKENLTSMAYMCLTVLEESSRNSSNHNKRNNPRGKASYRYSIDYDVLDKLGELTARGEELEARKAPKNGTLKPLTPQERDWIIRAVKAMIRRAGEWAYDPDGQHGLITMEQI